MKNIRKANHSDIKNIENLIELGYRGEYAKNGWTYESDLIDGERLQKGEIERDLANPKNQFFIYEENEIQGVICITNHGYYSEFGKFSVNPKLQSNGIGKMLIETIENFSKNNWGINIIRLCVLSVRKELFEFYKRRNYTDTGERIDFKKLHPYVIQKNENINLEIIIMEKTIS